MYLEKRRKIIDKEHYKLLYQNEMEQEAEWLRLGAVEKVNSIQYLLKNNGIEPHTILELGCGTGAVIQECQRRSIAQKYVAVDYSKEAVTYLRNNSEKIETIVANIASLSFSVEGSFDVVILSHVLEHLEKPGVFLTSVLQKIDFSYVIIEVPLEDLFISQLNLIMKNRTENKAGHVQFFTASTFEQLLVSSNLSIIDKRRYVPIFDLKTLHFVCVKDGLPKLKYIRKTITSHYLPKHLRFLWIWLCYAHYACLCRKKVQNSAKCPAIIIDG